MGAFIALAAGTIAGLAAPPHADAPALARARIQSPVAAPGAPVELSEAVAAVGPMAVQAQPLAGDDNDHDGIDTSPAAARAADRVARAKMAEFGLLDEPLDFDTITQKLLDTQAVGAQNNAEAEAADAVDSLPDSSLP